MGLSLKLLVAMNATPILWGLPPAGVGLYGVGSESYKGVNFASAFGQRSAKSKCRSVKSNLKCVDNNSQMWV